MQKTPEGCSLQGSEPKTPQGMMIWLCRINFIIILVVFQERNGDFLWENETPTAMVV